MVYKRRIISSYIYFVQVYLLFYNVDSWRGCVGVGLILWGMLVLLLLDLVSVLACPTEVSHPVVR